MNRILILDSDATETRRITSLIESTGNTAVSVTDVDRLRVEAPTSAAIFCPVDLWRSGMLGWSHGPVILLDRTPDIGRAVSAIKSGAADYLAAGTGDAELMQALDRALAESRSEPPVGGPFPIVGTSPPVCALIDSITRVGPTDSTVLIRGESGTGKELVARSIHAASQRRYAPLISLNCATVPPALIESELFGHEQGAQHGLLETALGGTLFLDEIGELPAAAQTRLLQALESNLDVRLITATQRDLEQLVATDQFRQDLFYRINVVSLKVPPLRERGEDILLLANAILSRAAEQLAKSGLEFSVEAQEDMRAYRWPGNVRELENAIERAVILSDGKVIDTSLLAIDVPRPQSREPAASAPEQTIEDYFVNFVTTHQETMTETELAVKLGISRKSLWERRQRLNIPRKKTKKRGRRRDVS